MKRIIQNIKNNPFTIIFAAIGGVAMGFAGYTTLQACTDLPFYAVMTISVLIGIAAVAAVCFLGWDTAKAVILKTAKKSLNKDNYEKVIEFVDSLKAAEQEQRDNAISAAEKEKSLEIARRIVEQWQEQQRAVENAQKLLADNNIDITSKPASDTAVVMGDNDAAEQPAPTADITAQTVQPAPTPPPVNTGTEYIYADGVPIVSITK